MKVNECHQPLQRSLLIACNPCIGNLAWLADQQTTINGSTGTADASSARHPQHWRSKTTRAGTLMDGEIIPQSHISSCLGQAGSLMIALEDTGAHHYVMGNSKMAVMDLTIQSRLMLAACCCRHHKSLLAPVQDYEMYAPDGASRLVTYASPSEPSSESAGRSNMR